MSKTSFGLLLASSFVSGLTSSSDNRLIYNQYVHGNKPPVRSPEMQFFVLKNRFAMEDCML